MRCRRNAKGDADGDDRRSMNTCGAGPQARRRAPSRPEGYPKPHDRHHRFETGGGMLPSDASTTPDRRRARPGRHPLHHVVGTGATLVTVSVASLLVAVPATLPTTARKTAIGRRGAGDRIGGAGRPRDVGAVALPLERQRRRAAGRDREARTLVADDRQAGGLLHDDRCDRGRRSVDGRRRIACVAAGGEEHAQAGRCCCS